MASQTQGIQQLLAAEKKAADKVAEARKRKARRLKQAKEEAQSEIEAYRLEREKQFKDFESKHLGSRDDVAAKIDKDMKMKLDIINRCMASNKELVIQQIMSYVYEIKPAIHKNIRVD
ncbi:V-type proton ATPase subunit G [Daphnia magna]|uniref:V-type proton ATPase subunit G n=2 Tax=Daphnia magna TaxID=35525 RepID=A0A0N8D104_9CRUS|nr:V-type proton ATPase subunit G [Daphnia magna]KAK4007615.1 hypothetical protein OUZ56_012769 [Daphnia magna]KZS10689.1 V-type proton ATPase subunit G [Daphnia magna]